MSKDIINNLEKNIKLSNYNKSSYWKKYLNNEINYHDIEKDLGFGSFQKKSKKKFLHYIFQKIVFNFKLHSLESYKQYKLSFDTYDRQIDVNTVRHIFTFDMLSKYVKPKKICIIGDGKINGLTGINKIFPHSKIYSVNLSETLINDYLILLKSDLDLKSSISVINSEDENDTNTRLTLVPSQNKKFLINKNIELFINIVSLQEMTINEVSNYFDIIRNNNAMFYCCNREEKVLPGGEILKFDDYPWGKCEMIFREYCSWHKRFYCFYYPFVKKYDGKILHSLVKY